MKNRLEEKGGKVAKYNVTVNEEKKFKGKSEYLVQNLGEESKEGETPIL